MIKRMLVALDADPDSLIATQYAVDLAQRFDAAVTGLAIVDTRRIATEVGPGGAVGGLYYAEQVRQALSTETRLAAQKLVEAFDDRMTAAEIRHETYIEEGAPTDCIVDDARYYDLLIIGQASHFYYAHPEHETHTLARIVKRAIVPTLVVQDYAEHNRRIIVAYDGSAPSARTMQRFAQFAPFGRDMVLDVVNVHPVEGKNDKRKSSLLVKMAAAFLRAHGFARVEETSRVGGAPAELLMEHARETEASLIVAGAHSVSAARRVAFGSTTHTLLKGSTVSLFLFH